MPLLLSALLTPLLHNCTATTSTITTITVYDKPPWLGRGRPAPLLRAQTTLPSSSTLAGGHFFASNTHSTVGNGHPNGHPYGNAVVPQIWPPPGVYAQLLADVEAEVAALEARGDVDDSSSYGDSSSIAASSSASGTRGDSPQGRGRHDVRLATSLKIIETVSCLSYLRVIVCTRIHIQHQSEPQHGYTLSKQLSHSHSSIQLLLKLLQCFNEVVALWYDVQRPQLVQRNGH
jgi:hypothetical protein